MEDYLLWTAATLVFIAILGGAALGLHLALASPAATRDLYRRHFSEPRRERLFLSSVGFFLTFATVRLITHAIRLGVGPFRDVSRGGVHVHHLVWGILVLLLVGYVWLLQLGTGTGSRAASRLTAIMYGLGAALTLDEFALWLRLEDVYWTREGRQSVEAVLLFGALLSLGVWGGPFFRALLRDTGRVVGFVGRRANTGAGPHPR